MTIIADMSINKFKFDKVYLRYMKMLPHYLFNKFNILYHMFLQNSRIFEKFQCWYVHFEDVFNACEQFRCKISRIGRCIMLEFSKKRSFVCFTIWQKRMLFFWENSYVQHIEKASFLDFLLQFLQLYKNVQFCAK